MNALKSILSPLAGTSAGGIQDTLVSGLISLSIRLDSYPINTEIGGYWWYSGDGSEGFGVGVEWVYRLYVVPGILSGHTD